MKSSFASRGVFLLSLGLLLAPASHGVSTEDGFACLHRLDVGCARRVADALMEANPSDPMAVSLAAHAAFYEGRFQDALGLLDSLEPVPSEARQVFQQLRSQFDDAARASEGFASHREDGVVVSYLPGVDRILVEEAVATLVAARKVLTEVLGEPPPQEILVEIYPTGRRFVLASSLGEEAVATTGVVALSKWARLLMTSPRALAGGYGWKDTLVHEYVHLAVAHLTDDEAPVWLHEGIARNLETWWRGERDAPLSPHDQSLLARALEDDDLVTFDEMHPSFAFLPSADRGALAYAQVKMLVREAMEAGGPRTLARTLQAIQEGEDPQDALARAAGYDEFQGLFDDAITTMKGLDLVERKLAALPVVLDGSGEYDADPLLAMRADLAEYARLGDLLREAGRPRAALVEYGKAQPADEPMSPLLADRVASCHSMLGEQDKAARILRASSRDYPGFARTWRGIGDLELEEGRPEAALAAYQRALDVDPFDPDTQGAVARIHKEMGQDDLAERHEGRRRILLTGGVL